LQEAFAKLGETVLPEEAEEMVRIAKKKPDFVKSMQMAAKGDRVGGAPAAGGAAKPGTVIG
jgi:hypothetical protein